MGESRGEQGAAASFGRLVEPLRVLFGNRSLRWLVIGFAAMTLAEWGYVTALAVDAFRSHGSVAVGLVGFRLFIASVGSLFNVRYLDRHPRGRVLTAIAGTRGAIVATSAALAATGAPLTPLLVLVALDAVVSAPYRPAQSAMLPVLARTPRELAAAAAGMSTVKTLSQALGAIAGGFLLVVTSPAVIFAGAAIFMLTAAVATNQFGGTPIRLSTAGASTGIRGLLRDTGSVVRHPYVGGILVVSGLRTFVRGMWIAVAVIASLRLLHAGSAGVGLLMLAAGVGALAAVPLSAALIGRRRIGGPTILAFVACGVPLVVIAGIPLFDTALFLVAAWGVGMAVADVATFSLLHRLLDTPLLPRVTGAIESAKLALEGLGALVGPLLASTLGIRWALALAGLPLPVVVVAGRKLLHRLDATAGDRAQVLTLLHAVPFLESLDMASLESLVGRLVHLKVPAETEVVRQGQDGDCFYIVRTGTADVLVDGFLVGSVTPGGYFGERALLRNVPRMATVRSREPMELLALGRADFVTALTGQEGATTGLAPARAHPDACELTLRQRVAVLSQVSLLSHLDSGALRQLAAHSRVEQWSEGALVVKEGDEGDRFFVLLEGRAVVSAGSRAVSELLPGDQFGEIALLHGVPRRADVTVTSPSTTMSLPREAFVSAVRSRVLAG
ncbi:MAG: cyclic nucleotide-binding domain-containing protein [Acidimicrobiales bacterium]